MNTNESEHLCERCDNLFDRIRGCGFVDCSNLYNDCLAYSENVERYFSNSPTVEFFRSNPERTECFVLSCPYFEQISYQKYIASAKWKETRRKRIELDGYKCKLCGSAINLCVHHLTYDHLGNENMDELVTLCKTCHNKLHEKDGANA